MPCIRRTKTGSCNHHICEYSGMTDNYCVDIIDGRCEAGLNCLAICRFAYKEIPGDYDPDWKRCDYHGGFYYMCLGTTIMIEVEKNHFHYIGLDQFHDKTPFHLADQYSDTLRNLQDQYGKIKIYYDKSRVIGDSK